MRRITMAQACMGMRDLGAIRMAHGDRPGDTGSMQPSPTRSVSRRSRALQSGTVRREDSGTIKGRVAVNIQVQMLAGLVILILVGCAGAPAIQEERHAADPVLNMLHRGILDLEENVEELNERIAELQQLAPVPDPTVQELRALDLSAWQLHQQQWMAQRERLFFAVHQIEQAEAHPSQRDDLWTQWTERQQQFLATLEDLRAQRHALERKRLTLESQLLQRYFK